MACTNGRVHPGLSNEITAVQINPYIEFGNLEVFGVIERARGVRADRVVRHPGHRLLSREPARAGHDVPVRAVAYTALLRDEYPAFGDAPYPAELVLEGPDVPPDWMTAAFRLILAILHLLAVWVLGIAWFFATVVAWFAILLTGRYPKVLYDFGWACCGGTRGWRRTCSCWTTIARRSRWSERRRAADVEARRW